MSRTIDDFKDFFRPEKEIEPTNLDELQQAQHIIDKALNHFRIALTFDDRTADTHDPVLVETYSRELLQVIINIINNAKDTLAETEQEQKNIRLMLKEESRFVDIIVCDNGPGVPSAIFDRIFEPCFSTKSKSSGTGLGLYMSKNIYRKVSGWKYPVQG